MPLLIKSLLRNVFKRKTFSRNIFMMSKEDFMDIKRIFEAAVRSVKPEYLMNTSIKVDSNNIFINGKKFSLSKNIFMVGFGKAVLGMAIALEKVLKNKLVLGIISVPEGIQDSLYLEMENGHMQIGQMIKVYEGAAQNIPDSNSLKAANKIKELVASLKESDLLFVLISGGGSALLPAPTYPLTLEDKKKVTTLLASSGATIEELNAVRKHLSDLKGGKLAELAKPAQVISLILSDIIGDTLNIIASGPTCENTDNPQYILSIIDKYNLKDKMPTTALEILEKSEKRDNDFSHVTNFILGNNQTALNAAASMSAELGYESIIMTNKLNGTARDVGQKLITLITAAIKNDNELFKTLSKELNLDQNELLSTLQKVKKNRGRLCILFGGETTVKVHGRGIGGRNQELALSAAIQMNENQLGCSIVLLSAGTDGIDGPTSAAGAIATASVIEEANSKMLDPNVYLDNNDTNTFFSILNDGQFLVKTGHTGTNVMDIIVVLVNFK